MVSGASYLFCLLTIFSSQNQNMNCYGEERFRITSYDFVLLFQYAVKGLTLGKLKKKTKLEFDQNEISDLAYILRPLPGKFPNVLVERIQAANVSKLHSVIVRYDSENLICDFEWCTRFTPGNNTAH